MTISVGLDLNGFMQKREYLDYVNPNSTDNHEDFIEQNEMDFEDVGCIFNVYDGILEFEETDPKWIGESMMDVFGSDFAHTVRDLAGAELYFNAFKGGCYVW